MPSHAKVSQREREREHREYVIVLLKLLRLPRKYLCKTIFWMELENLVNFFAGKNEFLWIFRPASIRTFFL